MSRIGTRKTGRPATYADLEAVPPHLVAEILAGDLVTHPRPSPRHATAHASLIEELAGPYQKRRRGGPGGWLFLTEPEIHLGEHVVVPDIAAWRREKMTDAPEGTGIKIVPDWVCEVLSPSTVSYDRTVKFRIYHQFRVGHLWYVDPVARTLEVFSWSDPHWIAHGNFGDFEDVSAPPFEAVSFNLGLLWPFDEPPVTEA
jgi:Uma2 family endonuclease